MFYRSSTSTSQHLPGQGALAQWRWPWRSRWRAAPRLRGSPRAWTRSLERVGTFCKSTRVNLDDARWIGSLICDIEHFLGFKFPVMVIKLGEFWTELYPENKRKYAINHESFLVNQGRFIPLFGWCTRQSTKHSWHWWRTAQWVVCGGVRIIPYLKATTST